MRVDCDKVGEIQTKDVKRGESVGRGTSPPFVRVLSKEQSKLSEGKVIKRTRRRRLNESCRIG